MPHLLLLLITGGMLQVIGEITGLSNPVQRCGGTNKVFQS